MDYTIIEIMEDDLYYVLALAWLCWTSFVVGLGLGYLVILFA
jgi:hypothetical protein